MCKGLLSILLSLSFFVSAAQPVLAADDVVIDMEDVAKDVASNPAKIGRFSHFIRNHIASDTLDIIIIYLGIPLVIANTIWALAFNYHFGVDATTSLILNESGGLAESGIAAIIFILYFLKIRGYIKAPKPDIDPAFLENSEKVLPTLLSKVFEKLSEMPVQSLSAEQMREIVNGLSVEVINQLKENNQI